MNCELHEIVEGPDAVDSTTLTDEETAGVKELEGVTQSTAPSGHTGDFQRISMARWRNSASPLVSMALLNSWFEELGLFDLTHVQTGILPQYYER